MFLELVKKSSPPLGGAQFKTRSCISIPSLGCEAKRGKTKKAAVGQPSDV